MYLIEKNNYILERGNWNVGLGKLGRGIWKFGTRFLSLVPRPYLITNFLSSFFICLYVGQNDSTNARNFLL